MEEITYTKQGDYLYPDLALPEQPKVNLGMYARQREAYLKEHKPVIYCNYLTSCTLAAHLAEIEQQAEERLELLIKQMAKAQGVTEKLKAKDMMRWVGMMNNIKHAAEEIVRDEIIYS